VVGQPIWPLTDTNPEADVPPQPVAGMCFTAEGDRVWSRDGEDARQPAPVVGEDDDGTPCEVCGRPCRYGSRHVPCGEYAMRRDKELAAAIERAKGGQE
jgi:hypothetical protein